MYYYMPHHDHWCYTGSLNAQLMTVLSGSRPSTSGICFKYYQKSLSASEAFEIWLCVLSIYCSDAPASESLIFCPLSSFSKLLHNSFWTIWKMFNDNRYLMHHYNVFSVLLIALKQGKKHLLILIVCIIFIFKDLLHDCLYAFFFIPITVFSKQSEQNLSWAPGKDWTQDISITEQTEQSFDLLV